MKLGLSIHDEDIINLSPLAWLGPDDLQSLIITSVGAYLGDGDLLEINQLRSLETLWLAGRESDYITDVGLQHIGKLPALKKLFFGSRSITDDGLVCLET